MLNYSPGAAMLPGAFFCLRLAKPSPSIGDLHNSTSPYTAFDGTLRVAASWSVRENGPRFPTRGLVRRIFHAVPYGMSVNATYDPTGRELLFITIDFSTL